MRAIREVSHQQRQWVHTQWSGRGFGLWARDEIRTRFSHQKSMGQPGGGALSQFARFCVVGTSNAIIDVGVQSLGAGDLPHTDDCAASGLQYGCRRASRHQQLRVEPALHIPRAWPAPAGRDRAFRRAGSQARRPSTIWCCWLSPASFRRSWQALRLRVNVRKLGAILGTMVLSFFGMRGFVFLGRWLSPDLPAHTGSLPSPSREDNARQDSSVVQELAPVAALKQRMEVLS
jgi:hypothetical protein